MLNGKVKTHDSKLKEVKDLLGVSEDRMAAAEFRA